MRYRPAELESYFKRLKEGDLDALDAILVSERARLFDYMMRMTGQLTRAMDAAEETIDAVRPVVDREESLQELLVLIYKTGRNFSIEIWNADTSRLENSAYVSPKDSKVGAQYADMVALEHVVRSLPARQREVLLLRDRFGFSPDEIAEITGYAVGDVEEMFAHALGVTEAALPGLADRVTVLLTNILPFPMPEDSEVVTQNLSMVFKDLKKSSRSTPGGWFKLVVAVALIAGLIYGIWNYEWVFAFVSQFLS